MESSRRMKSAYIVFPEPGKVEVREETVSAPGSGEIVCAADKSLVSIGTEIYCLQGRFDPGTGFAQWVKFPFRPGYSMAARVVGIGSDVAGLTEGDRVAIGQNIPHQQFFKIQAAKVHLLPEAISYEEATWMYLACTAQLGVRRAEHRLGETVGVLGLGMLGQLVVQYVALSGARRVIAIDPARRRLDIALAHGATHTLGLDAEAARPEIESITGGKMLDVLYEVTGNPAALAPSTWLLRRLGRVVLLGTTPMPSKQVVGPRLTRDSLAILGIHASMVPAQASEFNPWTRKEMIDLSLTT